MIRRRTLFQALGAAAVSGIALRPARAAALPQRRLLLLVAEGGLRSTIAFNPSSRYDLNPWGVAQGGPMPFGNALFAEDLSHDAPAWSAAVPSLATASARFAIIGGADHAIGTHRNGDHAVEGHYMGTGYAGGDAPGLAVVCNRHLVGPDTPLPVCTVGTAVSVGRALGFATGDWQQNVPLALDPTAMPAAGAVSEPVVLGTSFEDAIDARALARRRSLARKHLEVYLANKRALRRYGPLLVEPFLHLGDPDHLDATYQGISNQALREAFADDDELVGFALGMRLLQLGAPVVAVSFGAHAFDTHSDEESNVAHLYPRFARAVAGVSFALDQLPDPASPDRSMRESTLVCTMSEFSRSRGPLGGYDERDGTDHGFEDPGWRYQAHLLLTAGEHDGVIANTDDDNVPLGGDTSAIPTQELLAALATWAGVPVDVANDVWPVGTVLRPSEHAGSVTELVEG
jgi:uncharacterized protein DUF1501